MKHLNVFGSVLFASLVLACSSGTATDEDTEPSGTAGSAGAKAGSAGTSAGKGGSTTAGTGGSTTAGTGGSTAGTGGSTTGGTGGSTAGSGGSKAGSGGTAAGAGGSTGGAGGSTAGSGGSKAGSGGAAGGKAGAGGASAGSGGSTAGTGGTSGGSAGTGGSQGGSAGSAGKGIIIGGSGGTSAGGSAGTSGGGGTTVGGSGGASAGAGGSTAGAGGSTAGAAGTAGAGGAPPPTCGGLAFADPTCNGCYQTNCCATGDACAASADCITLVTCTANCADQACVNACEAASPAGVPIANAIYTCSDKNCSNECGGLYCGAVDLAGLGDASCSQCLVTSCCAESTACGNDEECKALVSCVEQPNCDQACIDACRAAHPNGDAAALDLLGFPGGCLSVNCDAACFGKEASCAGITDMAACNTCCDGNQPEGFAYAGLFFDNRCACDAGAACEAECGANYCQGAAASTACDTCLNALTQNSACIQAASTDCGGNAACTAWNNCTCN